MGYRLDVKAQTKDAQRMSRDEIQKPIRELLPQIEKDFAGVRGRVLRAVEGLARSVTLSDVEKQIRLFSAVASKKS
jgi:hypothetical protein